jgi:hypothetical protein
MRTAAVARGVVSVSVFGLAAVKADEGGAGLIGTVVTATKRSGTASFALEQRTYVGETAAVLTAAGKVDFDAGRPAAALTPPSRQPSGDMVVDGDTTSSTSGRPRRRSPRARIGSLCRAGRAGGCRRRVSSTAAGPC